MIGPRAALRRQAEGLWAAVTAARRFRGDLAPHRRRLTAAFLFSVAYTTAKVAEPWPLKIVLDNVIGGRPLGSPVPVLNARFDGAPLELLAAATAAILVIALARGILYYYQSLYTAEVGQSVVMAVRRRLFAHVQRLPMSFHSRSRTGDVLSRLTGDILLLRDLVVSALLSVMSQLVVVVSYLAIMLWMDWRLALVSAVAVPTIFVLASVYTSRIREATRSQRRREGELAAQIHEVLSGIHVVQMFAREDDEDHRLHGLNHRSLETGLKATRLEARLNRAVEVAIAGATAATLGIGAQRVLAGALTPGDLIVFVSYMRSFYKPLRRISGVAQRAGKAASCVERITDLLDLTSDVADGEETAPSFKGRLQLEEVSFGYDDSRRVLHDVSLDIAPGTTVALVGPSGAGKTTILGLVPRIHDPVAGVVLIDGLDIRRFTLRSLRDQISVVPQDGMLFAGEIGHNIAYGRPAATRDQIEAAARAANIHETIVGLPAGYRTIIGERGATLSGGQRQRLAIARALIRDTPFVLLDEPTTGLDAEAEALVLEAMERLLAGRTALIIAHRLSTVRRADRIVVVEAGRVVEQGTHGELMAHRGSFRHLHELQGAAIGPESTRRAG